MTPGQTTRERGQRSGRVYSDRPAHERTETRCACPDPSPRKAAECFAQKPKDLDARSRWRGPKGVLRFVPRLCIRIPPRFPRLVRAKKEPPKSRFVVECIARA